MATSHRNFGSFYKKTIDNVEYTIPTKYQDLAHVGHGAFGSVIRATDTETGKFVAIKRMLKPFDTPIHAKRTYRELKLLMYLNHPDSQVVQLYDVFTPDPSSKNFDTLYLVLNYADFDLNRVIRRRIPFSEDHIKQIIYSLLRGVKFIHSAGILHRDLKPENVGIDQNSNVTILDFGLARVITNIDFTDYVATRWWRAPEVYTNQKHYNTKLDLWSIGCIMAELIRLRPIFPGNDHIDQLNKIFEIIGTPDPALVNAICTPDAAAYINRLSYRPPADFKELFGLIYDPVTGEATSGVSQEGIDFLRRLLSFDYRIRPTAVEAIADPFFESIRDPDDEPTKEPIVDEHEDKDYSTEKWKSLIYDLIQKFQPPAWATEKDDPNDSVSSMEDNNS